MVDNHLLPRLWNRISQAFVSVPVRLKITGIMMLPVLILGFALTYWIRTGLSDWLSYLLTDDRVQIAMQNGSRSVIIVTILAASISVLLASLLMLFLTNPLLQLRQVAHDVAAGDFTSRAKIWNKDEIGEVALAVNQMIDRLVLGQQELQQTNRRLEAVNRVIAATSRELDLQQVLDAALITTLAVTGLEQGWILLRDPLEPGDTSFQLASHVGFDATATGILRTAPSGFCSCQRDLMSGKLNRQAGRHACHHLAEIGGPDEVLEHVTVPLEVRDQRFGVMNLVCPHSEDVSGDELELLTTIGAHLSEIAANAQLHARLVEKEAVRQALLQALVQTQEDERARLARELHDGAGQTLTSLLVRLKVLEKHASTDKLRGNVSELCALVSETIEQIRSMSYQLRPSALEQFGLEVALRELVQDMADAASLEATCHLNIENRRLPFAVESTLYRIAQECLTNVVRHAGATRIEVELIELPYAICLRVEDDGCGFDPENIIEEDSRRRLGLVSMQERTEMLKGSLEILSAPDAGTSVQVRIPLPVEEKV